MGFPTFRWVLPGFTRFQWVLLGFTGFYLKPVGFPTFHWVLPGFTCFHWVLLGFAWIQWVFLRFTGFYRVSLVFNGFLHWVLLGLVGFTGNFLFSSPSFPFRHQFSLGRDRLALSSIGWSSGCPSKARLDTSGPPFVLCFLFFPCYGSTYHSLVLSHSYIWWSANQVLPSFDERNQIDLISLVPTGFGRGRQPVAGAVLPSEILRRQPSFDQVRPSFSPLFFLNKTSFFFHRYPRIDTFLCIFTPVRHWRDGATAVKRKSKLVKKERKKERKKRRRHGMCWRQDLGLLSPFLFFLLKQNEITGPARLFLLIYFCCPISSLDYRLGFGRPSSRRYCLSWKENENVEVE